jgi:hypothetical protein
MRKQISILLILLAFATPVFAGPLQQSDDPNFSEGYSGAGSVDIQKFNINQEISENCQTCHASQLDRHGHSNPAHTAGGSLQQIINSGGAGADGAKGP